MLNRLSPFIKISTTLQNFDLKSVTSLRLPPDDIDDTVNELDSVRVVTLRPIVPCATLSGVHTIDMAEHHNVLIGQNSNVVFSIFCCKYPLSSPRAESARAFTGRWNSHSGRGEDFLSRQQIFFTETAVTPERKVEKSFPMWEINRHAEG